MKYIEGRYQVPGADFTDYEDGCTWQLVKLPRDWRALMLRYYLCSDNLRPCALNPGCRTTSHKFMKLQLNSLHKALVLC